MFKRYFFFLAAIAIVLSFTACDDDDGPGMDTDSSVTLNFKSSFNGDPLIMYQNEYDYYEEMNLKLQLFQFYITDVTLLTEANETSEGQELFEVELVSFKDVQSDAAAAEGVSVTAEEIPAGSYKGLRIGLGLVPSLNATDPGDYTTDHPLSDNYWSASAGYIFTKIEGNGDLNGDGDFQDDNAGLTFHLGGDELFREKIFIQDIVVPENGNLTLNFDVDLNRVLSTGADNFVDFREVQVDHTNDMNLANFISDNLKEALLLK